MSNKIFKDFFHSVSDILNFPDPIELVKGLIFQNILALVIGASGKGKTFIVLDLLLSIATGRKFLDQFEVVKGNVLYCYGEGGFGLRKRIMAWLIAKEESISDHSFMATKTVLNLANRNEVDAFIARLLEFPDYLEDLKIIAFDTLARCSVGSEENSNTERGLIIENIDRIREKLGVTVLLVHHTGKDESKGERGGSALRGAMDTVFELKGGNTKTSVSLAMTKQKDDEEADTINLKFASVDLTNGKTSIVPYISGISSRPAANDNLSEKEKYMMEVIISLGSENIQEALVRKAWKQTEWHKIRSSDFADIRAKLINKELIEIKGTLISLTDTSILNLSKETDERNKQAL